MDGVELVLRAELSHLRGLLALSMLMTERRQEQDIVHLATTAVPALVRARPVGVRLSGQGWVAAPGTQLPDDATRLELDRRLDRLPPEGGPVTVANAVWAWGFGLHSLGERVGHLVVAADQVPSSSDSLLLRSLAQQTGIALANARLHVTRQATNAKLAETVAALEYQTAIHDRLTRVATGGEGADGIVRTLHELTGMAATIEDGAGTVLAQAGGSAPNPLRPLGSRQRATLLGRAIRAGRPVRDGDRLLVVARPRADVVGVLSLNDPDRRAGEQELVALEHGATVLAIELARMLSVAETELRLGRDLVADLVRGRVDGAVARAQALGHDLSRPYRALVIGHHAAIDPQAVLRAVRDTVAAGRPALTMQQADTLVVLAAVPSGSARSPWQRLAEALHASPRGRRCRIGVGGLCHGPQDFAGSFRQANLALRLAEFTGGRQGVVLHDELGVYQLLSEATDPAALEAFVRTWLGPLLDYDAARGAQLVDTLAHHLDCGGHYDATAQALALGRSTVRYRLGRIRQLTGHDLTDPDTRFQLQLATRAWLSLRALTQDRSSGS